MRNIPRVLLISCFIFQGLLASAQSEVLQTMSDELARSFETLKTQEVPPYYISYEITSDESAAVRGEFGEVFYKNASVRNFLDIDLRVGDFDVDNTREVRGAGRGGSGFGWGGGGLVSLDDPEALRLKLWFLTDAKFRAAVERLTRVKAAMRDQVEREDKSGDFSPATVSESVDAFVELNADLDSWSEKVEMYTAPFVDAEHIRTNYASITGNIEMRWFVNTEGTRTFVAQPLYRIFVQATAKAEDGMVLPLYESYHANSIENLPSDEEILQDVKQMIHDLDQLQEAPLVEPYTGPAILSGRATGVFFHEILGHRLEGHRQKSEDEGQTFKKKLGEQVLPTSFSVTFDPHLRNYGGEDLAGHYQYDNEGVPGQRVVAIENGILKGFLMSRTPIDGFPESNGHGRKNVGNSVVARQSNLIVEVEDPYSPEELKSMLLERVKAEGKEFGLYIDNIQGGFTLTGRSMPNAFNVDPILVKKIYPDGREQMVRGVDLIGTPLTSFSRIEAGATDMAIFNGLCGAESGQVPVSAIAPSILVSQIEVQKAASSRDIPPILPVPSPDPMLNINSLGDETVSALPTSITTLQP